MRVRGVPWWAGRLVALLLLLAGAGQGRADLIMFNVGGATFTAGGDTVTLAPRTFTLDLTPGVPVTANLQLGNFIVGDSGTLDQTFPFTLSRTATANGVAGTISQPGTLLISPTIDTLTLSSGATATFDLGSQGVVSVTPLGLTQSATMLGTFPITVQGTFLLTPAGQADIPEPSALVLLGLGGLGLAGYAWRRRA